MVLTMVLLQSGCFASIDLVSGVQAQYRGLGCVNRCSHCDPGTAPQFCAPPPSPHPTPPQKATLAHGCTYCGFGIPAAVLRFSTTGMGPAKALLLRRCHKHAFMTLLAGSTHVLPALSAMGLGRETSKQKASSI